MFTSASQGMVSPEKASFHPDWWVKLQAKAFLQWRTKHVWNWDTHGNKIMSNLKNYNGFNVEGYNFQTAADLLQIVLFQQSLDEWLCPLFGHLGVITQNSVRNKAEKQNDTRQQTFKTRLMSFWENKSEVQEATCTWYVWGSPHSSCDTDWARSWSAPERSGRWDWILFLKLSGDRLVIIMIFRIKTTVLDDRATVQQKVKTFSTHTRALSLWYSSFSSPWDKNINVVTVYRAGSIELTVCFHFSIM